MRWNVLIPLFIYLLLLIGIAWVVFRRRRAIAVGDQSAHYYIGNRNLGWLVLVFTLLSSLASAGTFIGGPGLVYGGGYGWVLAFMGQAPASFVILGLLGKKFAIVARKLGAVTVIDVLRHRYESRFVVGLGSLGIVLFLIAYMTAQFTGGGRVIQAVTGLPYVWVVVIVAGVLVIYTSLGGFLADVVSDTLQGVIMFFGGIVLWIAILTAIGGMAPVNDAVVEQDPDLLLLPGAADLFSWTIFSYFIVFGLASLALPHLTVRAMSYRDSKTVHQAMIVGPVVCAVFTLGFSTMGMVAHPYFPDLASGDLALPKLILEVLPGPLAGALLAAPLAAIMSTVDSMLLVVSSTIVRDVYRRYIRQNASDREIALLGPTVSAVIGIIVLLLALNPPKYLELVVIFAIGGLGSLFFIPLLVGLYWRRGSTLGAICGMVGGLVYYILATQWLPQLALGMQSVVMSLVVSAVLYVIGSYVSGPPPQRILIKFWGTSQDVNRVLQAER
ncbi:MAG: sodium/pantothenate symporter [Streptosporangiales bacterium]